MNNLFDDVLSKAKGAAYVATKKTGEIVEVSKLKLKCIQLNGQIKDEYEKLGSAVYSMRKNGYENEELIASVSAEIDSLLKELDEVSSKVESIKSIIVCPTCGKKNPDTSYYCSKCGSRIAQEFTNDYSDVISNLVEEDDCDE